MKQILLISILFKILLLNFLLETCNAQINFRKTYIDSTYGNISYDFLNTPDSGYIIVSNEYIVNVDYTGGSIFKISSNGQFLWNKSFHHSGQYPVFKTPCTLNNGNFIVSAILDSTGAFGFIKFDSIGNVLTIVQFNDFIYHPLSHINSVVCKYSRQDSTIIFAGNDSTNSFPAIIKTDLNGNVLWSKYFHFNIGCTENIVSLDLDNSGNILVCCNDAFSTCLSDSVIKIIKFDTNGTLIWSKKIINGRWELRDLKCNKNNQVILSGKMVGYSPPPFIIKLDSSGNLIYYKYYWLANTGQSIETSFEACENYNVFLIQNFWQVGWYGQSILLTDSYGNSIWQKTFDDTIYESTNVNVKKTPDGGVMFVGSNIYKFDSLFQTNCPQSNFAVVDATYPVTDTLLQIIVDTFSMQSSTPNYQLTMNSHTLIEEDICLSLNTSNSHSLKPKISIYPNPSEELIIVSIHDLENIKSNFRILDLSGKIVQNEKEILIDQNKFEIDLSALNSGIYFLEIYFDNYYFIKKITKIMNK